MKKILFSGLLLLAFLSCSEDDNADQIADQPDTGIDNPDSGNEDPGSEVSVVINEVAYLGDSIEILNNGNVAVDVSNYQLCLGPGTYRRLADIVTQGDTDLAPGEFLVVAYEMPTAEGGLGLYIDNSGFGDSSNILDFVQWGAAGSPRENVAAEAGIWTAGTFIEVTGNGNTTLAYDGNGDAASDWTETGTATFGEENIISSPEAVSSIVISEVEFRGDKVELYNNGDVSVDLSDYQLCLGPGGTYRRIADLPWDGNLNLAPGEFLVLTYDQINQGAGLINGQEGTGGLGLWINGNDFTDSSALVDFVQWGAAGSPREVVAVEAGIWSAGDYIEVTASNENSIAYDGTGNSSSDWSETTTTTFGANNEFSDPEIISVVINEVEYLNDDIIELYNNGNQTVDLSNYWMCLGPGSYFRIGDAAMTTILEGNVNLAPGEFLLISPATLEAPDNSGGLGLYINNSGFANPDLIRDFVQWGAAGNARESVAVAAGIWTTGDFIPTVNPGSSIAYDGNGDSSSDWYEDTTPTLGSGNNDSSGYTNNSDNDNNNDGGYDYGSDDSDNGNGYGN